MQGKVFTPHVQTDSLAVQGPHGGSERHGVIVHVLLEEKTFSGFMMVTGDTPHGSRKAHLLGQGMDRGPEGRLSAPAMSTSLVDTLLQRMLTGIERMLYVLSQAIGQGWHIGGRRTVRNTTCKYRRALMQDRQSVRSTA